MTIWCYAGVSDAECRLGEGTCFEPVRVVFSLTELYVSVSWGIEEGRKEAYNVAGVQLREILREVGIGRRIMLNALKLDDHHTIHQQLREEGVHGCIVPLLEYETYNQCVQAIEVWNR